MNVGCRFFFHANKETFKRFNFANGKYYVISTGPKSLANTSEKIIYRKNVNTTKNAKHFLTQKMLDVYCRHTILTRVGLKKQLDLKKCPLFFYT